MTGQSIQRNLSKDSLFGQRMRLAVCVHGFDLLVDGGFQTVGGFEGAMGEMVGFEGFPFALDVVEFRGVFGQPFRREPVADARRGRRASLCWCARAVVEDDATGLTARPGLARRCGRAARAGR